MKLGEFTEEHQLEAARRQYESGRADIEIEPKATALLVVDMMDEFVKPNWCNFWVPDATRQVPKIRRLIDAFHEADLPVIYTAYEVGLKGKNFPVSEYLVPIVTDSGFLEGTLEKVAIYSEIAPSDDDYLILKHCYSGFHGTELDLVLKGLGISTVVICGTMSNFCCGATAREAFWYGYKVIFGSDVTSTDDPDLHEAELKTIRRGFGRVMDSEEIIADLGGTHDD